MYTFSRPEHVTNCLLVQNHTGIVGNTVVGVVKGLWSVIDKTTVYYLYVGCQQANTSMSRLSQCLSADRADIGFVNNRNYTGISTWTTSTDQMAI